MARGGETGGVGNRDGLGGVHVGVVDLDGVEECRRRGPSAGGGAPFAGATRTPTDDGEEVQIFEEGGGVVRAGGAHDDVADVGVVGVQVDDQAIDERSHLAIEHREAAKDDHATIGERRGGVVGASLKGLRQGGEGTGDGVVDLGGLQEALGAVGAEGGPTKEEHFVGAGDKGCCVGVAAARLHLGAIALGVAGTTEGVHQTHHHGAGDVEAALGDAEGHGAADGDGEHVGSSGVGAGEDVVAIALKAHDDLVTKAHAHALGGFGLEGHDGVRRRTRRHHPVAGDGADHAALLATGLADGEVHRDELGATSANGDGASDGADGQGAKSGE